MKVLIRKHFRYPGDVLRIQRALSDAGYDVSPCEAEHLWETYSDSMCAGWLMLYDDDADIVQAVRPYFSTEFDEP